MKLELVIVLASMSREKVACTVVAVETLVALLVGTLDVMVGGEGGCAAVEKLHEKGLASAFPSDALIVVASVAVYAAESAS